MIPRLALAGVDVKTNLTHLQELLEQYPFLEVGVLYTFDPEGRKRYPDLDFVARVTDLLKDRCAIHVCGGRALDQLLLDKIEHLIHPGMRIQINGCRVMEMAEYACQKFSDHFVITQYNHKNQSHLDIKATNHHLLIDNSCGTGTHPDAWPAMTLAVTEKFVGFAGGLKSSNLNGSIRTFNMLRGADNYWVDMESALRNNEDDFSLHLVEYYCKLLQLAK